MENDSNPQTRDILDKLGASDLLRINPRTLDEWMRRKIVPYAKLPSGTVRFRRSQLLEFIAKHEVSQ